MADCNDRFQKSVASLTLAGKAERAQQSYTRALRMLSAFYDRRHPESITEPELEAYFLHCKQHDRWSANTLPIGYCAIRFYFARVLGRDWQLFNYLRARNESRLPAILSQDEVRALLNCVHSAHNRAFLCTVYACVLRLQEALHIEISDIDAQRMMIRRSISLYLNKKKPSSMPGFSNNVLKRPCGSSQTLWVSPRHRD